MKFLKRNTTIQPYKDFWTWFQKNGQTFFNIVKEQNDIEKNFLDKIFPKLQDLHDGCNCLTGMYDDHTAELILSAEGVIKNVVFMEEIICAAPKIKGWKFTALKPSSSTDALGVEIDGYVFNKDNISFYANELPDYPDEIDIIIVYDALTEGNKSKILRGINIFLDHYLGELEFITNIDNITLINRAEAQKELIPITKLKDFLTLRQKAFVEKYDATRLNTENNQYSIFKTELESGNVLLSLIDTGLLKWDAKASHPWIATFIFKYPNGNNGMPNKKDYALLDDIESNIKIELKDIAGYLNIGRRTGDGEREIYFACKDFRTPSKVFFDIQKKYALDFVAIEFDIYKDKYWKSFNCFNR